jgi:putative membrane protein
MKFDIFLKGMLMGLCDLVPGISGGTIAFITGIYERLILTVSKVLSFSFFKESFTAFLSFNFKNIKNVFRKYDLYFLITLLLGIITAILLGSRIILYLLDVYFVLTMSFFIGLILASSILIYKSIETHKTVHLLFGILGFFIGLSLLFFVPATVQITLPYIFISGFIGITALFLPGISGSYLLYLLGTYEVILAALHDFNVIYLFVFILGALLGSIFISRIISYLLKQYHSETLYVLFGFVIGALIIPLRDINAAGFSFYEILWSLLLFFIGFILVFVFSLLSKPLKK